MHETCSNGCWLYPKNMSSYCCPRCQSTGITIHQQVSLSFALAQFIVSDHNRNRINYKTNKIMKTNMKFSKKELTDFYDGRTFQDIRLWSNNNEEIHTIDLALYVDAFCPFDKSKTTMTLIMFSILNLPPEERLG